MKKLTRDVSGPKPALNFLISTGESRASSSKGDAFDVVLIALFPASPVTAYDPGPQGTYTLTAST